MELPGDSRQTTWQRFLDGTTGAQRFMLAIGALAGAVLAIGGVIAGGATLLGSDEEGPRVRPGDGKVQTVENQSTQADEFVELLLRAAGGKAVQLNHNVLTPKGDAHFRLEYNCASPTGCNYVRLEAASDPPAEIVGGVWYQGCWSIAKDGAGFGADHLDIEFTKTGEVCP